ncbi:SLBB domain-containing protein, partial [Athalassotoga sp.]|uniref:SLBB domain-containing protein n=1 Tax=Athalassotoga sp. TaxID=2022597 RepID=UPI003D06C825
VYVLGSVKSPGAIKITGPTAKLSDIFALAGGALDDANLRDVNIVTPSGTSITVNFYDFMTGKSIVDPTVDVGDTIIVPSLKQDGIFVMGGVTNPGFVQYTPNISILDIFKNTGGFDQNADLRNVIVFYKNQTTGQTINLSGIYQGKVPNIKIEPGMVFLIPVFSMQYVTILGAVKNPGTYNLPPSNSESLAETLGLAGGLLNWNEGKIEVISQSQSVTYDVSPQVLASINVKPGDVIYIPKVPNDYVTVIGAVRTPGTYELTSSNPQPLTKILGLAGGLLDWNLGQIEIIAGTQTTTCQVSPQNLATLNVYPGEVVYVPTTLSMKVYVFGDVNNPGVYQFSPNMKALEAILMAGGPTAAGDMSNVYLFKGGPNNYPQILNLSKDGIPTNNILISPGDILYVPQSGLYNLMQIVSNVTSLFNLADSGIYLWKSVVPATPYSTSTVASQGAGR